MILVEKIGKFEILPAFDIDFYGSEGNPLFAVRDICKLFDRRLDGASKLASACGDARILKAYSGGQVRELLFVSEEGLYNIILSFNNRFSRIFYKESMLKLEQYYEKRGFNKTDMVQDLVGKMFA